MGERLETALGTLRGARERGVRVFRGIPFAAPPRGSQRFRAPGPAAPWAGVRDATHHGASPPQRTDSLVERLGLGPPGPTDEDCLTLNVHTPAVDGAPRPVLVFVHGGAFATGTSAAPLYDGGRLAARGDVVVVTFNYRVGALGFAALPESAPGGGGANFGLLDQIAALRFVRDHIGAFGGDPACVTVFGESAGAGSILALTGMPEAKGLFRRAIVQSAAPEGVLELREGLARSAALLRALGREPSDFAALAHVDPEALLEAQLRCAAAGPHRTGMLYAPVVDGCTLPLRPLAAAQQGFAAEIDLLIGTTRDEMRLYDLRPDSDEALVALLAWQAGGAEGARSRAAAALVEACRAARRARGESVAPADLYPAIQTELSLRVHATQIAAGRAGSGATFMYLFSWPSALDGGRRGACHAIDLPFVFGNLDAPGMPEFAGRGPEAERLAGRVMDAWTAFAQTGRPAHAGLGEWPAYEPARRATMELGVESGAVEAPLEGERAAFDAWPWAGPAPA